MADELKLTDIGSMKLFNSSIWTNQEEFIQVSSNGATTQSQRLKALVPWMAKATDMTSNAISELPFDVVGEGGKVIDSSDDWKNNLGGIPNPQSLFYKLAASLCTGKAYLIPTTVSKRIVELQYCAPHTIQENITAQGLQDFQRTTDKGANGRYVPVTDKGLAGEMMHFWLPDSDVEIGPALTTPASTALLSASMLLSMDNTIKTIAERGFISPTVLMAKGMADPDKRKEAEKFWDRFVRGWTTTIAKILNGEAMTILKIGAGMDELRGIYPELSKQAIENIGTAYGIPAALFMSDMAFASEVNPMIKVWYTTSVFIKIYHTIEEGFNTQLLNKFGATLKFKPETLPAFQKDEGERASVFKTYKDAGMKPSIAAEIAGVELPDGIEYEDLDPDEPEPVPPPVVADNTNPTVAPADDTATTVTNLDAEQIKGLDLWRQVAVRNFKKGKGKALDFECKALPVEIAEGIRSRLAVAMTEGEIVKAFEIKAQSDTTDQMAHELRMAREWLELHSN